jgi:hypothetical protein
LRYVCHTDYVIPDKPKNILQVGDVQITAKEQKMLLKYPYVENQKHVIFYLKPSFGLAPLYIFSKEPETLPGLATAEKDSSETVEIEASAPATLPAIGTRNALITGPVMGPDPDGLKEGNAPTGTTTRNAAGMIVVGEPFFNYVPMPDSRFGFMIKDFEVKTGKIDVFFTDFNKEALEYLKRAEKIVYMKEKSEFCIVGKGFFFLSKIYASKYTDDIKQGHALITIKNKEKKDLNLEPFGKQPEGKTTLLTIDNPNNNSQNKKLLMVINSSEMKSLGDYEFDGTAPFQGYEGAVYEDVGKGIFVCSTPTTLIVKTNDWTNIYTYNFIAESKVDPLERPVIDEKNNRLRIRDTTMTNGTESFEILIDLERCTRDNLRREIRTSGEPLDSK